jgi:hypothetical protein
LYQKGGCASLFCSQDEERRRDLFIASAAAHKSRRKAMNPR